MSGDGAYIVLHGVTLPAIGTAFLAVINLITVTQGLLG